MFVFHLPEIPFMLSSTQRRQIVCRYLFLSASSSQFPSPVTTESTPSPPLDFTSAAPLSWLAEAEKKQKEEEDGRQIAVCADFFAVNVPVAHAPALVLCAPSASTGTANRIASLTLAHPTRLVQQNDV